MEKSELEVKAKGFFDKGWRLKKVHEEKDYLIISPGGNAYSARDLAHEELFTFFDHATIMERGEAEKFCNLFLEDLNLLRTYREYVEYS